MTIQMKATEQYFHVVLFNMLNRVVLALKSVDETLVCEPTEQRNSAILSLHALILKSDFFI